MTRNEFQLYQTAAMEGTMRDNQNPAFTFQGTDTKLLSQIARGEINAQELAKRELESRGMDINGKWAGLNSEIK
jgi:hypothetical protein